MDKINKFLKSFADVNAEYGVSNYYGFCLISNDLSETVFSAMFKNKLLNKDAQVDLFALSDWKSQIFKQRHDSEKYWFGVTPTNFQLEGLSPRQFLINLLTEFFFPSNYEIFRIEVDNKGYYACCFEEYIFKSDSKIFLLSFQVHD